jgi:alkylation response protein AidB-like acyl-CoA dehydrogenase
MALVREGIEQETAVAADSLLAHAWPASTRRLWLHDPALPMPLWQQATDAGWFDLLVPESDGGLGLTAVEACAITEAAGRFLLPGPVADNLVLSPLAGSSAGGTSTRPILCRLYAHAAPRRADDGFAAVRGGAVHAHHLHGEWAASADHLIVDAGDSLVAVAGSGPHTHVSRLDGRDAFRQACLVDLDGAPVVDVIAEGRAARELRSTIRRLSLVLIASELLGCADRMLEMSLAHATSRHQFGRTIGSFQAVQHRLADMKVAVESTRSICYFAQVAVRDADAEADTLAIVAKAHASAAAREVAEAALQVHGGIGFTADCDLSLYLLRALTLQSAWGDDRAWCRALGQRTLAAAAATAGGGRSGRGREQLDTAVHIGEGIVQSKPPTDGDGGGRR